MAIAYRSDTGTLTGDAVTGAASISFVTTQPSAGDLVVGGGSFEPLGTSSTLLVTDNQGNTYTVPDELRETGTGATTFPLTTTYAALAHKENVASSGTFTISFNTQVNGSYYSCGAVAFSGAATSSALDVHTAGGTIDANQSSQGTGTTGTTSQADSVAVTALSVRNGISVTSLTVSGYTVTASQPDGANHTVGGLAYKILSATGTQTATWTYGATSGNATDDHAGLIAVYKGTASVSNSIAPMFYPSRVFFPT